MRPQTQTQLVCLSSRLSRSLFTAPPRNKARTLAKLSPKPETNSLSLKLRATTGRAVVKSSGEVLDQAQREKEGVVDALRNALWSPPEEKKHKKKKKKDEAVTPNTDNLHDAGASERFQQMYGVEGWTKEDWKEDWGEDKLKPQGSNSEAKYRTSVRTTTPPHLDEGLPITFSRRVEGLLEDVTKNVLEDLPPPTKQQPVATLEHGLERVLFNPGVHWLRDPRSRVYNYPPALGIIPKVFDFAFERLTGFIRSSRDQDLWSLANAENRKFAGSTSSLSGMLCHIYFLLSGNKQVDISPMSLEYRKESTNFTPGQRMAASVMFNYKDGVYLIDSDPTKQDMTEKNILTWMGTLLEKYLTMTSKEFLTYMRSQPSQTKVLEEPVREAYRYSKSDKFVMRSQLDCHDKRLPGTGVFDIKTRACLPIRMDILNFKENSGYLIRQNQGLMESFEREYYDLIRSAFLKYSFQVRIGNMDGVFVAYHNTARVFGFQYVPLEDMDRRIFGEAPGTGDRVFQKCVEMLELVAEEITSCFPGQSVRCTFETEDGGARDMNVWIEPVDWSPPSSESSTSSGLDSKSENLRPIRQLVVSASSFSGNSPAKGAKCVPTMDKPWTVYWSIKRLNSGPGRDDDVRAGLRAAKERQFRALVLPAGVSPEKIQEWWEGLDFGGVGKTAHVPVAPIDGEDGEDAELDINALLERNEAAEQVTTNAAAEASSNKSDSFWTEYFVHPDRRIQELRSIARQGREDTIKLALEERGKPRVLLGVGEVEWEDAVAEAEIEERERAAEELARKEEMEKKMLEEMRLQQEQEAAKSDELLSADVKPLGEVSDFSSWRPSMERLSSPESAVSVEDNHGSITDAAQAVSEDEMDIQANAAQQDDAPDTATWALAEHEEVSPVEEDHREADVHASLPQDPPNHDTLPAEMLDIDDVSSSVEVDSGIRGISDVEGDALSVEVEDTDKSAVLEGDVSPVDEKEGETSTPVQDSVSTQPSGSNESPTSNFESSRSTPGLPQKSNDISSS